MMATTSRVPEPGETRRIPTEPVPQPERRARSRASERADLIGMLLVAPNVAMFSVFVAIPVVVALGLSFFSWNVFGEPRFVGLDNFVRLLSDERAHNSAIVTVIVLVAGTVPTVLLGLVCGLLLTARLPATRLIRLMYYVPIIVSFVAAAVLWRWIFDPQYGLMNWLLGLVGVDGPAWLSQPETALLAVTIVIVWRNIPLATIIYVAAIQELSQEMLEAARIDGAGPLARAVHIVWPNIRPATVLVGVVSMIGVIFNSFDVVAVMTRGGPLRATDILVYYMYDVAFNQLEMGYASVLASLMFLAIFGVAIALLRFQRRAEEA